MAYPIFLDVTLMESDTMFDDIIQTESMNLNDLKHDVDHDKELVFNKVNNYCNCKNQTTCSIPCKNEFKSTKKS